MRTGKPPFLVACGLAIALMAVAGPNAAHAGRNCESPKLSAQTMQQALDLAEHTHQALERSGARVVVLARVGQDLSKYGLVYSHFGWAYRDETAKAWRVVHKLNHCGSDEAAVYRQGLADFFLDDLHEYRAGIVIPAPQVQAALLPILVDNARVPVMHTRSYSMVAYPWSQRYQQSNQWALETLAYAMQPGSSDRSHAQAWLRSRGYQPTTLHLSTFKRLGARVTAANVAFDDHPNGQRFAGRIDTVTVDSVFSFLRKSGLAGEPDVVR